MNQINSQNLRAIEATAKPGTRVLLSCGDIQLLVQGEDIISLMPIVSLTPPQSPQACGSVEFEQQIFPAFCFNKSLQLHAVAPPTQTALVIMNAMGNHFALACSEIIKLEDDLRIYSLPNNMRSRKQPFTEFAIIDAKAAGVTSPAELLRVLQLRGAVLTATTAQQVREANL